MTATRARRAGFTLIEMLVVIGIIAILMAIAFPVFNRARESSRQTQCMANLHNIAQAIRMYRMDEGTYPGPYDPVMGTGGLNALYPTYVPSRGSFLCPDDQTVPGNDLKNGYSMRQVTLYLPPDWKQSNMFTRDLLAQANSMYIDTYGQLPYLDPTTRQWKSFMDMWADPTFFREHYSSYNMLYNYVGYIDYPPAAKADRTKPYPFTLCADYLQTAGSLGSNGIGFYYGDNPTFWASWFFWDPSSATQAALLNLGSDTIGNKASSAPISDARDYIHTWLMFDLARQVYWPDLDPTNLTGANLDSPYRLKDDLGRPLWELDTSGDPTQAMPYGMPSAVFPGLINRNAPDNTIVTRCPFHRGVSKVAKDIVLRLDGSAALVPGRDYNWARQSGLTH